MRNMAEVEQDKDRVWHCAGHRLQFPWTGEAEELRRAEWDEFGWSGETEAGLYSVGGEQMVSKW